MSFPQVTLNTEHVAQERYAAQVVHILQIDDSVADKSLRAFVQLGDNPQFRYWIVVQQGDAYSTNWTNDDVANAVNQHFQQ
jgi:hypothetical protein